jgi:uncharacterized ion transporter superfamily protein YfcC
MEDDKFNFMKLRVPHTYVLLFSLLLIAAASTYLIPAGEYNRFEKDGRQIVDPNSYHPVAPNPAGIDEVFMAFPNGLLEVAHIVFYIFIVGGAFGVIAGPAPSKPASISSCAASANFRVSWCRR